MKDKKRNDGRYGVDCDGTPGYTTKVVQPKRHGVDKDHDNNSNIKEVKFEGYGSDRCR